MAEMVHLPKFTPAAKKLWSLIPKSTQDLLVRNVWCGECVSQTVIVSYAGRVVSGQLLLEGECKACGSAVARLIEN